VLFFFFSIYFFVLHLWCWLLRAPAVASNVYVSSIFNNCQNFLLQTLCRSRTTWWTSISAPLLDFLLALTTFTWYTATWPTSPWPRRVWMCTTTIWLIWSPPRPCSAGPGAFWFSVLFLCVVFMCMLSVRRVFLCALMDIAVQTRVQHSFCPCPLLTLLPIFCNCLRFLSHSPYQCTERLCQTVCLRQAMPG